MEGYAEIELEKKIVDELLTTVVEDALIKFFDKHQ